MNDIILIHYLCNTKSKRSDMKVVNSLPEKTEVSNAFGPIAKSITKRNNQYKIRVLLSDFQNATKIADSFGLFDSVERQQVVDIII